MCKYLSGMVAGLVVGATVGMMVMPQLDRKTQRCVRRRGQKMLDFMEDSYDDLMGKFN